MKIHNNCPSKSPHITKGLPSFEDRRKHPALLSCCISISHYEIKVFYSESACIRENLNQVIPTKGYGSTELLGKPRVGRCPKKAIHYPRFGEAP